MRRCEMDIGGRGIDMVVTHQRLQHRQVHPGLGQGGAERVPQRVRMTGRHPGDRPVIAKHRAQPGRGQRLPRCGPLATRNNASAGRSPVARRAGRSGSARRRRDPTAPGVPCRPCRSPAPSRRAMSTSPTCSPSTSAERSPENSISPAIARSRSVRKLASRAAVSARSKPRGNRRGSRTRRPRPAASAGSDAPAARPAATGRIGRPPPGPLGIGFTTAGSRIARKSNSPEIAASRRLIVDGAYPRRPAARAIEHHVAARPTGQRRAPAERPGTAAAHRCSPPARRAPRRPASGRTPAGRTHRPAPCAASNPDRRDSPGSR